MTICPRMTLDTVPQNQSDARAGIMSEAGRSRRGAPFWSWLSSDGKLRHGVSPAAPRGYSARSGSSRRKCVGAAPGDVSHGPKAKYKEGAARAARAIRTEAPGK